MTEQQMRDFFAHIAATADRWQREGGGWVGDHAYLEPGGDVVTFRDSYSEGTEEIPLLAFYDFDTAIAEERERKAEEERKWQAWQEERDRRNYEALRQKFEGR